MWKFVVMRTKGNDAEIVRWCESKVEAVQFGEAYFAALPKEEGVVSVDEVETDEQGRRIEGYKRVHHVWR